MTLRIEETFEVRTSTASAWRHLREPRELARCLPGAELADQPQGERWAGCMTVRVGPARVAYEGTVAMEERDDASRRLRLRAEGTERLDGGTLRLATTVALADAGDDRTMVRVAADIDVDGRVAQLGPGMVEGVARPLLREFVAGVRASLEPRVSGTDGTATTEESLTLSGAFREHPMLRNTDTAMPTPSSSLSPRQATAMPVKRETRRVSLLPRLWHAALDRLRPPRGPR